ncbi:MAG: hypothetical protein JSV98_05390 [candidate division WOR-3 bacterium]|nr:MAG: hypothetical protein JSV98_05390 [candidate division WOR-3 bacterium]
MTKRISLAVFLISLPAFAVEYCPGIICHGGLAPSSWGTLTSTEPAYQLGLGLNIWLTDRVGIHTGFQYAWYYYDYEPNLKWSCGSLLLPIDLLYGIRTGKSKILLGAGLAICKTLNAKGSVGFITPISIPDSILETNIGPEFMVGMEMNFQSICLLPSLRYAYGLDGPSNTYWDREEETSHHYILLGLAMMVRM